MGWNWPGNESNEGPGVTLTAEQVNKAAAEAHDAARALFGLDPRPLRFPLFRVEDGPVRPSASDGRKNMTLYHMGAPIPDTPGLDLSLAITDVESRQHDEDQLSAFVMNRILSVTVDWLKNPTPPPSSKTGGDPL